MPEQTAPDPQDHAENPASEDGSGTVTRPKRSRKSAVRPSSAPPGQLPPWKVLLHKDDKNPLEFVVTAITDLTPLSQQDATARMSEARKIGVALLLTTHRERAELYKDQFETKGLTVTIEPVEK